MVQVQSRGSELTIALWGDNSDRLANISNQEEDMMLIITSLYLKMIGKEYKLCLTSATKLYLNLEHFGHVDQMRNRYQIRNTRVQIEQAVTDEPSSMKELMNQDRVSISELISLGKETHNQIGRHRTIGQGEEVLIKNATPYDDMLYQCEVTERDIHANLDNTSIHCGSQNIHANSLTTFAKGLSLQIVPVPSFKGSLKVMLLHGNLDIWVYELKNLPNMDMFHKTLTNMFAKRLGNVTNKIEGHVSKKRILLLRTVILWDPKLLESWQGGKLTLYQDAHVPNGCLPVLKLEGGVPYEYGKCWYDIFNAISQARRLIYITGWTVYHKV
ncbi:hypothetical protein IFM89_035871 [Coptis chinensis]|uniref:Uncharacterized protein n=1 Tax=Coptis chinensis TaxID=261450 RepID=A0A835H2U6_9MAGN|nr:hypothetical protein IFM89_035871 [Coptis chinensis]